MKSKLKQLIEKIIIQELWSAVPSMGSSTGAMSMARNAYGHGGNEQLVMKGLNPATQAMVDDEQSEINQNIEDQRWSIHNKHSSAGGRAILNTLQDDETNYQDTEGRPEDEREFDSIEDLEEEYLHERNPSDIFYMDLPGNMRPNAIEDPQIHTPPNEIEGDYLIDDIVDELEDYNEEEIELQEDTPVWKIATPVNNREPLVKRPLGHTSLPPAERTPGPGGASYIPFHKDFVPDEWSQPEDVEDEDMDGIADDIDLDQKSELQQKVDEGKRQKKHKERHRMRYAADKTPSSEQIRAQVEEARKVLLGLTEMFMMSGNEELMRDITYMISNLRKAEKQIVDSPSLNEEELDEKFASKAQQKYFYAQAGKGGKKGAKWKEMADEFADDTPDFSKLPERAPKKK